MPAAAAVGLSVIVTCTLLVLGVQLEKLIVQLKIYTPGINPVTVVEGNNGSVIVGVLGPLTNVQLPVPMAGVFAANVAVVAKHKF